MLFSQTPILLFGSVVQLLVAVVSWRMSGQRWLLGWSIAIVIVIVARLLLERAFRRRHERPNRVAVWSRRFRMGAWAMATMWGSASWVIVSRVDLHVQIIVVAAEGVIVMGAAASNASSPMTVIGQTIIGLGPLIIACLIDPDHSYRVVGVFVSLTFGAALVVMRRLNEKTVLLLCVNEENAALVSASRRANAELAAANTLLEAAATMDALTGIANRRRFDIAMLHEAGRMQREPGELALLLLDIDWFKSFNDRYGHQAGDDCLRRIAQTFAASLRRPADLVARYGGEEFVAVLPQTSLAAAIALAEGVRASVETLAIVNAGVPGGIVTVSIGVASFGTDRFSKPEEFLWAADQALYVAKGDGRNCVRAAAVTHAQSGRRDVRADALS